MYRRVLNMLTYVYIHLDWDVQFISTIYIHHGQHIITLRTVAAGYDCRMGLVGLHEKCNAGCLPRSILKRKQTEANHIKKCWKETGPVTVEDGKTVPEVVGRCLECEKPQQSNIWAALTEDSKIHGWHLCLSKKRRQGPRHKESLRVMALQKEQLE